MFGKLIVLFAIIALVQAASYDNVFELMQQMTGSKNSSSSSTNNTAENVMSIQKFTGYYQQMKDKIPMAGGNKDSDKSYIPTSDTINSSVQQMTGSKNSSSSSTNNTAENVMSIQKLTGYYQQMKDKIPMPGGNKDSDNSYIPTSDTINSANIIPRSL